MGTLVVTAMQVEGREEGRLRKELSFVLQPALLSPGRERSEQATRQRRFWMTAQQYVVAPCCC